MIKSFPRKSKLALHKGRKFQPPPARRDTRAGSAWTPSELSRADMLAAGIAGESKTPLWKSAGQAAGLGLLLTSGAQASEIAATEIVAQTKIEKALETTEVQELLADLPADFKSLMAGLSDTQIQVLGGGINGKTKVSFVTVDNRKAFIKGSAYGREVWPYVINTVNRVSARPETLLEPAAKEELHKAVDMMASMTKAQRKGLAKAMDIINSY